MKTFVFVTGFLVMSLPATATTILSTIDPHAYNGFIPFGAMEVAWSQTSGFSDVDIAVSLSPSGGGPPFSISGTAYLMSQVGPGTTEANELSKVPFSVTSATFEIVPLTLFSGLVLGPGTYHLVLTGEHGAGEDGGWSLFDSSRGGAVVAAPGVALVEGAAWVPASAAYPPANDFGMRWYHGLAWAVDVAGAPSDDVPEPSTQLFMLSGLLLFAARLRLRSRS